MTMKHRLQNHRFVSQVIEYIHRNPYKFQHLNWNEKNKSIEDCFNKPGNRASLILIGKEKCLTKFSIVCNFKGLVEPDCPTG